MRGPAKWICYYRYVILDIYSRYVVGWTVAFRESGPLAEVRIRQTLTKQGISRDQLTLQADRGSSMTSKPVAFLLADLGVTQSHARPHVSDDSPCSEAQFKTLKYRPVRLDRGRPGALPALLRLVQRRTPPRLGLHVPADVHYGTAHAVRDKRAGVLNTAFDALAERAASVYTRPEGTGTGRTVWPRQLDITAGQAGRLTCIDQTSMPRILRDYV